MNGIRTPLTSLTFVCDEYDIDLVMECVVNRLSRKIHQCLWIFTDNDKTFKDGEN